MAIANLKVKIDSEGMLAKVQEINEKAQELDRLVKELRSMSGEFVSFNSDDLSRYRKRKHKSKAPAGHTTGADNRLIDKAISSVFRGDTATGSRTVNIFSYGIVRWHSEA